MTRSAALFVTFLMCWQMPATALETTTEDEKAVHAALSAFVEAFNNLDWDAFESSFTEDATIFMPFGVPHRAGLHETFVPLFEMVRARRSGPPFLAISPEDLNVEVSGDWAIATFHLRGLGGRPEDEIHRRTLVLRRQGRVWKIHHLHASIAGPS